MALNVPIGAVIISESTVCPSGWDNITSYGSNSGAFIRIGTPTLSGGKAVVAGGNDTHVHVYSFWLKNPSNALNPTTTNAVAVNFPEDTNCTACGSIRTGCPTSWFTTAEYPQNCYGEPSYALSSPHTHRTPFMARDTAAYNTPIPPYIGVNLCQRIS